MSSHDLHIDLAVPESVASVFARAGAGATIVGGAVRDRLLGCDRVTDWDFATRLGPEELAREFPDPTWFDARLGSLSLVVEDYDVNLTTYRVDGPYSDARHPDRVEFVDRPELDAVRRDFTINAIYCEPSGRIVDPVRGIEDLRQRTLSVVGDPRTRLAEDPLRVLRGVRLAARFGLAIDAATRDAMSALRDEVAAISSARRCDEIDRGLSDAGGGWLRLLAELGLASAVDPSLGRLRVDEVCGELDRARGRGRTAMWHALLGAVPDPGDLARRLAVPRELRPRRAELAELPVGGADVVALGVAAGPAVGEILAELRERIAADSDRASALLELERIVASRIKRPGGPVDNS